MTDFRKALRKTGDGFKPWAFYEAKKEAQKDVIKYRAHKLGVTCFVIDVQTGDILVETRSKDQALNPEELDLVSGHVDNDETAREAMIRELAEEVQIPEEESIPNLQTIITGKEDYENLYNDMNFSKSGLFLIAFFCLLRNGKDGIQLQESEVKSIEWLPMEEVFRMIQDGNTRFPRAEGFDYTEIFNIIRQKYEHAKNPEQTQDQGR